MKFNLIFSILCLSLCSMNANAADVRTLNDVINNVRPSEIDTSTRADMLRELGQSVGYRAGFIAQSKTISEDLQKREKELDRVFNFAPIITADGSLPPVIVEAKNIASVTPGQIRISDQVFNILKPEEFVAVPPTWRDYLYTGLLVPEETDEDIPPEDALPKNRSEQEIWTKAVSKGWEEGTTQAKSILDVNFRRLDRDFVGMMRYRSLADKGLVSRTQIAKEYKVVAAESDGQTLLLNTQDKLITKPAEFQTDSEKWVPQVSQSQTQYQYGVR